MCDYFYDPICNKTRFNDMRKLLGFEIIEPGQMNPHKSIIYKVLCLSKIFIPAGGNGKRVHTVTLLSSERKIVLSCYVYFQDIFYWGIARKYYMCSQSFCVDCSCIFTGKSIIRFFFHFFLLSRHLTPSFCL